MNASRGFKSRERDTLQYGLADKKPEEGAWNTPSFADGDVKPIGESLRCLQHSRSAELAAARGSCGGYEVKA